MQSLEDLKSTLAKCGPIRPEVAPVIAQYQDLVDESLSLLHKIQALERIHPTSEDVSAPPQN